MFDLHVRAKSNFDAGYTQVSIRATNIDRIPSTIVNIYEGDISRVKPYRHNWVVGLISNELVERSGPDTFTRCLAVFAR